MPDDLESISVTELPDCNTKILLTSVYLSCNNNRLPTSGFDKILNFHRNCIIAGDFNTHNTGWNCKGINRKGRELLNFIGNTPFLNIIFQILPPIILTAAILLLSILLSLITSHTTLPLKLSIFSIRTKCQFFWPWIWEWKRFSPHPPSTFTDWRQFQNTLTCSKLLFPLIRNTPQLDSAVSELTDVVNSALQNSSREAKSLRIHELPSHVKILIRKRNTARKLYQFLRNPGF